MAEAAEVTRMKACPFCGGAAIVLKGDEHHWIECDECGVMLESYGSREEAIAAWNSRAERKEDRDERTENNARLRNYDAG